MNKLVKLFSFCSTLAGDAAGHTFTDLTAGTSYNVSIVTEHGTKLSTPVSVTLWTSEFYRYTI